jgi:hypothetical protein
MLNCRTTRILALTAGILIAVIDRPAHGAAPSSKTIVAAIKSGVNFLLSQEQGPTAWERPKCTPWWVNDIGGKTAIATEALLDVQQTLHLRRLNIFSQKCRRPLSI